MLLGTKKRKSRRYEAGMLKIEKRLFFLPKLNKVTTESGRGMRSVRRSLTLNKITKWLGVKGEFSKIASKKLRVR